MKTNDKIQYWSNMLNEAMDDKGGKQIDERRMAGPAAARNGGIDEIADMREKLATGVVEFEFWKHDPDGGPDIIRKAIGTTNEQIVPVDARRAADPNYDENIASYTRAGRSNFIIWYWDLEKNGARCFNTNRFERIINYERTNKRDDGRVQRFGDIFVHRDVDDGVQPLTPERAREIQNEIAQEYNIANAGRDFTPADNHRFDGAVPGAQAVVPNGLRIEIVGGEPVLKIEFAKRGTENDPPYQLCVNDLRAEIRQGWNIDIKRVEVTGVIEY